MPFEFLLGGVAASSAAIITNPVDVVKTRFQLQGQVGNGSRPYRNVYQAIWAIAQHEGVVGLQRGVLASMTYQFLMNGLRFGCYQTLVSSGAIYKGDGSVSFPRSVVCGAVAGSVSAFIGNPLYLVKTRMQACSSSPHLAVGMQHNYRNLYFGLRHIHRQEGLSGLWRGAYASVVRVSTGSAAQLSVFSKSKDLIARALNRPYDSHLVSFLGSSTAGFCVVTIIHPFDLVSTRLFNQSATRAPGSAAGAQLYRGMIHCFRSVIREEGVRGLYGGFWAGYARIAPHTFLCLFIWDELRLLKKSLDG